ncbi:unnamed protein product [Calypogeia fissa]
MGSMVVQQRSSVVAMTNTTTTMTSDRNSSNEPGTSSPSTSTSSSSRVSFVNSALATVRDVALPYKAMRTVAIAITSLVSFVPVWKLYLPGLWFSQVRPDLWWWTTAVAANRSSSSTATVVGSSMVVAAAAAVGTATAAVTGGYNEVNDPRVRRHLARNSTAQVILDGVERLCGILDPPTERRTLEVVNSRGQTLFTQSWMPASPNAIKNLKGVVILLHGLNEHSGRYDNFACQLNSQGYGVYAMDWIGHGGSDGLHGYVESLDQVVLDTKLYLKLVTADHPDVPVFIFGHSTGGAIALKTSFIASDEKMFRGIVLTSPAVRVKPAHPLVGALAPLFSILLPRYQIKLATRAGVVVSRDPLAVIAKYNDPLVYTGPIRIRTGTEILRIGTFLQNNFEKVTIPFFVLHGSDDKITDPTGSQDLYQKASSEQKSIQIYEGLLHDLLFELEKDVVIRDIISWLDSMLQHP